VVDHIPVPIVEYDGHKWGALAFLGYDHEITCEGTIKLVEQQYTFRDNHKVRLYKLKKQVFWKIPPKALDISEVPVRRVQRR
jgi:hypothetical protein